MYSKPNQKVVINKDEQAKIDKNNKDPKKFVVSRLRGNEEAAMKNLNYGAFKLWMMFSADAQEFKRAFSPTQAEADLGVSQPTARSGFKELVEKGYLVQIGEGNMYEFYQVPQKKQPAIKLKVEKRYIIDDDDVIYEMSYSEFKNAVLEGGDYTEEEIRTAWDSCEVVKED